MMYVLAVIGLLTVLMMSVVIIWCVIPGESLKDGLKKWVDESKDDL